MLTTGITLAIVGLVGDAVVAILALINLRSVAGSVMGDATGRLNQDFNGTFQKAGRGIGRHFALAAVGVIFGLILVVGVFLTVVALVQA